jgi:hypothetical protein
MSPRPHIAVAGSGLSGLHTAVQLAPSADVTVYERLPVAGGEHWEDPSHARLIAEAQRLGVRFAPGTQVLRWEGDRLLAVGTFGGTVAADALVVATGHRPPTRADLRIDGHRCAGVVPATLALHLLHQGVRLGTEVVIAGDAPWAHECVRLMKDASVRWISGPSARITATHGMPRITGVTVVDGDDVEQIACDCLILAGPPLPYRNVDGAVLDDDPAVFAQGPGDHAQIGQRAAREALALAQNESRTRIAVEPRIGQPL